MYNSKLKNIMKKIFNLINLESLKKNLKTTISRFPISSLIILKISALFLILNHWYFTYLAEQEFWRIIASLIITFFLSVWVYLKTEWLNFNWLKRNLSQIIPILFWIFFYSGFSANLENFENLIFFILTLAWIISFLFFAPYPKKFLLEKLKETVYYTYFYKISVVFLTSFILWITLFILWNIWIASVFELFDLSWLNHSEIIWDWAIFALAFLTPIFALTQIPSKEKCQENHFNENAFFSFLTKYIATPFIFVYFIILYTYTAKVLMNFWEWPKWEVSWMVIWFSIFWFITYIFSYIFQDKNNFIKIFRKYFPFAVLPQILMLAYAICLRIAQYDITINRYFVVVFWFWLTVISLYYIFSKLKKLSFIPATLTIFTILISIWPWSVYELPENRQLQRLEKNLEKAWILKENWEIKILEKKSDISKKLSKEIYWWIDYLCDFENCNQIIELFSIQYKEILEKDIENFEKRKKEDLEFLEENEKNFSEENKEKIKKDILEREYEKPREREIVIWITDLIKVQNHHWDFQTENQTIYFNLENNINIFPINVSGYSQILKLNEREYWEWKNNFWKLKLETWKIEIIQNWEKTAEISIKEFLDEILTEYKKSWIKKLKTEEMTIIKDWYKIIFENLTLRNPEYKSEKKDEENLYNLYWNWYILIK